MSIQLLPQELIDEIINFLEDEWNISPEPLVSCNSVCRSFRARSRPLLFKIIMLYDAASCRHFQEILVSSPEVAFFPRGLDILDPAFLEDDEVAMTWIAQDPVLPVILSSLIRLRSISIVSEPGYDDWGRHVRPFAIQHASDALHKSLIGALRSPHLECIRLEGVIVDSCHNLFNFLADCGPSIKSLEVLSLWHNEEGDVGQCAGGLSLPVSTGSRLQLRTCSIHISECIVDYLLSRHSAVDIQSVWGLALHLKHARLGVRSRASSLLTHVVDLVIEDFYTERTPEIFDLGSCGKLRFIHFIPRVNITKTNCWSYLARTLATITTDILETVEIDAYVDWLDNTIPSTSIINEFDWTALDSVLSRPSMHNLKKVRLTLTTFSLPQNDQVDVILKTGFPLLLKKGIKVQMSHMNLDG
ncbi:uncharacterized protein BT62DRAFT_1005367 [Guyanagaster necrorhizus]|uniref:F-box domain-containing protein n=1 Tax=Guyanagaster necrorhizus TaxID=856835 RepID=A0A9P7VT23_9AGAR|nr:uncharacterized protein BT62DRAFT_1005367 [Guyanagaster necrorhizus MCA 3950]KAG7446971.1 hypothetical protein BT62DRAFT_1005367 [Guyanagaster necrorhizus MCA 3950]